MAAKGGSVDWQGEGGYPVTRARWGERTITVVATRRPKHAPAGWIKAKRSTPMGEQWVWIRERDMLPNTGSDRP